MGGIMLGIKSEKDRVRRINSQRKTDHRQQEPLMLYYVWKWILAMAYWCIRAKFILMSCYYWKSTKKIIFYRNIKKWPKLQKQRSEDRGKEKLEFCLAEKKRPRSKFSLVGKKERKASLVGSMESRTQHDSRAVKQGAGSIYNSIKSKTGERKAFIILPKKTWERHL